MVVVLCAPVTNCTFLSPNSFHIYASGTFLRNCTKPCSVNDNCSCQCTKRTNFNPLHNRHPSTDRQSLSQLTTSGRPTVMRSGGRASMDGWNGLLFKTRHRCQTPPQIFIYDSSNNVPLGLGKIKKSSAVAEMGDRRHSRHGPKRGGLLCPFRRGAGSPSNTAWPGPKFTYVPSGILIHPAVWPQ